MTHRAGNQEHEPELISSSSLTAATRWMDSNWQYAGVVAGLFYLAALPLFPARWRLYDLLLWLQLPIYIVHQFEEHVHDRFRRYANSHLGEGQQVLTPRAVLLINVLGVWAVDFLALYLAAFLYRGAGLLAFYLAIVNAFIHFAGALITRAYDPGLITAAVLLFPLGLWGAITYSSACGLPSKDHLTALALVVGLHLAIISYVLRRRTRLIRDA